jgi:SAM-dependent methyltransferase
MMLEIVMNAEPECKEPRNSVFAEPVWIDDLSVCSFYHTMDIPGLGLVQGEWDLRQSADIYLGNVAFEGKRVLDVGTTDGFLCFHVERCGAREVVGLDLSPAHTWDIVPFATIDLEAIHQQRREGIQKINNSFWLAHRLYGSRARLIYSDVYSFPKTAGRFDIAVFGAILLHLRDPFLALQRVLSCVDETAIVVELLWPSKFLSYLLCGVLGQPILCFVPDPVIQFPYETWWAIPPVTVKRWLSVLGFKYSRVLYHRQRHRFKSHWLYTVVASRSKHYAK